MDVENVTEVEMKKLTPAVEDKDAEKDKMEGTKVQEEEDKEKVQYAEKAEGQEKEEKDNLQEKEGEETVHCKPINPSENDYMTLMTSSSPKQNKDVYRSVHLYKRISAVFIILSLLLLALVLALAIKLYKVHPCQKCSDVSAEVEHKQNYPPKNGYQCFICERGWVKFKNSCYFMSKERLNWQQSSEACQKKGGDLVTIDNEHVQKFLTMHGDMLYWIGLHYSDGKKWMWLNNSAPIQSYWANGQPEPDSHGFCALLIGRPSDMKNWHSKLCTMVSHYICQKE